MRHRCSDCREREAMARGRCNTCYARWRRRELRFARLGKRRPCVLCSSWFEPMREDHEYCCPGCQRMSQNLQRRRRTGEEVLATRDAKQAKMWAASMAENGLRRFHPRAAASKIADPDSGYFIPWRRSCGLYAIRVRWPDDKEEAA